MFQKFMFLFVILLVVPVVKAEPERIWPGVVETADCNVVSVDSAGGAVAGDRVGSYLGRMLFGATGEAIGGTAGAVVGGKGLAQDIKECSLVIRLTGGEGEPVFVFSKSKGKVYSRGDFVRLFVVGTTGVLIESIPGLADDVI